jgi:hypothetical protein
VVHLFYGCIGRFSQFNIISSKAAGAGLKALKAVTDLKAVKGGGELGAGPLMAIINKLWVFELYS